MTINVGLLITYIISMLLMIVFPIALAFFLVRKFKVSWWVILAGVLTYLVSQVVHYPVLQAISKLFQQGSLPVPSTEWIPLFNAVILGFLAALFEESARYFGLLLVRKKVKRVPSAVGLGVGHGGMESIGFAVWPFFPLYGSALINFIYILSYNPGAQIAKGVATDQVQYVLAQIGQFWANAWHMGLLLGVERVMAISTQILLTILVWKAIRSRNFLWFGLAFLYHMLVDGVAVFLGFNNWGYWPIEGVMAIFFLANLYLIYYFWKEESAAKEEGSDEEEDEEDEDEDEDIDEDDEEKPEEIVKKNSPRKDKVKQEEGEEKKTDEVVKKNPLRKNTKVKEADEENPDIDEDGFSR